MPAIKEQKALLRMSVLEAARSLDPQYTRSADQAILSHLISLPAYQNAEYVFCFYGTAFEIQTQAFLEKVLSDGKHLALPLCISKGIMQARLINDLSDLAPGRYGLMEPAADTPVLPPGQIDFAVIPCVTCDREGNRIGHGGGYYDRFFKDLPDTPCALICREILLSDQVRSLCEPHDVRFCPVITECGVYQRD